MQCSIVRDVETSIEFYREELVFSLISRDFLACFDISGVLRACACACEFCLKRGEGKKLVLLRRCRAVHAQAVPLALCVLHTGLTALLTRATERD